MRKELYVLYMIKICQNCDLSLCASSLVGAYYLQTPDARAIFYMTIYYIIIARVL